MIHKEMKIEDVLRTYPQTVAVFQGFGVDCAECQLSEYEDVEHDIARNGFRIDMLSRIGVFLEEHMERAAAPTTPRGTRRGASS